jgi:hypothetical protein
MGALGPTIAKCSTAFSSCCARARRAADDVSFPRLGLKVIAAHISTMNGGTCRSADAFLLGS